VTPRLMYGFCAIMAWPDLQSVCLLCKGLCLSVIKTNGHDGALG